MGDYTKISLALPVDLTREQINEKIISIARKHRMEVKQWPPPSIRYSLFPQDYEVPALPGWKSDELYFGTVINISKENRGMVLEKFYHDNVESCSKVTFTFHSSHINYARPKPGLATSYREYLERFFKEVHLELSAIKTIGFNDSSFYYIDAIEQKDIGYTEECHNDYLFYPVIWFGIANTSYYRGKNNFIEVLSKAYQRWRIIFPSFPSKPEKIEELDENNVFFVAYPILSGLTPPYPGYFEQPEYRKSDLPKLVAEVERIHGIKIDNGSFSGDEED